MPTAVVAVSHLSFEADPLTTVLTSLVETFGLRPGRLPAPVVARARLLARDVPVPELLAPFIDSYGPGFLSRPMEPGRTFDEQVQILRETPDEVIRRDLATEEDFVASAGGPPTVGGRRYWRRWRDEPRRSMSRYCSLLQAFRSAVVDGLYPRFERVLDREVHRLERATDQWGPEIPLGHLHPDIRFADGRLIWRRSLWGPQQGWSPDTLTFKPMICSPATRMSDLGYSSYTGMAHASIGVATGSLKVGGEPVRTGDHLDLLIGEARARVVRNLRVLPGSTTDLAADLGYAPSSISYHLRAFARAGVVESHRTGGSVCYHLTSRGVALARL